MTEQDRSSRTSHQVNEVRVHSNPKFAKIRDVLWFHQSSQLHNVDPSPQTDYSPQTQPALFERKTFSGVFNGGAANSCSFLLLRLLSVVSAFVNKAHVSPRPRFAAMIRVLLFISALFSLLSACTFCLLPFQSPHCIDFALPMSAFRAAISMNSYAFLNCRIWMPPNQEPRPTILYNIRVS